MGERSQSIVLRWSASYASVNSMLTGTAPKSVSAAFWPALPARTCLPLSSSAVLISELQLSEYTPLPRMGVSGVTPSSSYRSRRA